MNLRNRAPGIFHGFVSSICEFCFLIVSFEYCSIVSVGSRRNGDLIRDSQQRRGNELTEGQFFEGLAVCFGEEDW